MSESPVEMLARALLYEGYVLYPYRPSVKNRQRWTFGGVYPAAWSAVQEGVDPNVMQTECLLEADDAATVRVRVRFLHLVDRTVGRLLSPAEELPEGQEPAIEEVQSLEVGQRHVQAWQEAVEREVDLGETRVEELLKESKCCAFSFAAQRTVEPLRAPGAPIVAVLIRRQQAVVGRVELSATLLEKNILQLTVRIANQTEMSPATESSRDEALMRTLVSTHTILETRGGGFVSQTDPPELLKMHAAKCSNVGTWPVLVGVAGERRTMLSSPIIIEDYPKIAPESPGDLFDSSEIDEILTLRIMTLTEEEKRVAAGVDDRVRDLLARTESLAREQLMNLHGTLREVSPEPHGVRGGSGKSPVQSARTHGVELRPGDSVRLRPLGRADVMDIALEGKAATIVSIEQDFENRVYVAVVVDDDPGKDLGIKGQPGHRFFFGIEEVEPLARTEAIL